MTETDKITAYSYGLIHACRSTGATSLTITHKNVTHKGKKVGSWKITVKKIK